jgi:hypothetical protein
MSKIALNSAKNCRETARFFWTADRGYPMHVVRNGRGLHMNRRFKELLALLLLGLSIALAPIACSSSSGDDGGVDAMTPG